MVVVPDGLPHMVLTHCPPGEYALLEGFNAVRRDDTAAERAVAWARWSSQQRFEQALATALGSGLFKSLRSLVAQRRNVRIFFHFVRFVNVSLCCREYDIVIFFLNFSD